MRRSMKWLLGLSLLAACQSTAEPEPGTLYFGYTAVDPATKTHEPRSWMIVRGETISEQGQGRPPQGEGLERRDMTGLFALPGLVDGHAHITSGPHAVEMADGAPVVTIESVDGITQFHARMALASGITTVRNPGGDPVANARYDENVASGAWAGPEALHAGAVIQPPPFGGNAFAYPATPAEWDEEAERQAALGMSYFKLYSSLTEDELRLGIEAAHRHGLAAIAHLDAVSWSRAAALGIDGLEHALPTSPDLLEPGARQDYLNGLGPDSKHTYRWFEFADFDGPLFQDMLSALSANGVTTNMTLQVNHLTYGGGGFETLFSAEDLQHIHPDVLAASQEFLVAGAAGWTGEDLARAQAVVPKLYEFVRRLHDAGVPMMIGTDSNGGGPFLAFEMALHEDAGLSRWDILNMASSQATKLLDLADRTGRIEEGLEADVVFLRGDPAQDLRHIRSVAAVLSNGREFDPEALMRDARASLEGDAID
ncbi:amidohydrolase family protein [Parvularcula oceani]|uniref:amidohydrolase family protein n=1 Tax=Parvularcula oceani TaxID=1247963 RepID=UPI00138E245A|nr:amidohydrolase family protein [Parvularcula oceani]